MRCARSNFVSTIGLGRDYISSVEGRRNFLRCMLVRWLAAVRARWVRERRFCVLLLLLFIEIGAMVWNFSVHRTFPDHASEMECTAATVWQMVKRGEDGGGYNLDTNAAPFLLDYVRTKPSALGEILDRLRGKNETADKILENLPSATDTDEYRTTAAVYLGRLGVAARPAMPALLAIMADDQESGHLRSSCYYSLTQLKEDLPSYTEHLCKLLSKPDSLTQQFAAELLGLVGPEAKPAVPMLLTQATNANSACAAAAGFALWRIDHQADVAVAALTNALGAEPAMGHALTLRRLAEIGPAAAAAGTAVVPFLEFGRIEVRDQAERTLATIDPALLGKSLSALNAKSGEHIELFIKKLENNELMINHTASLLAFEGEHARQMVPRLIKLIQPTSDKPRKFGINIFAAELLGEVGPDAKVAVPSLEEMMGHGEGIEEVIAAEALIKICPTNAKSISVLTNACCKRLAQSSMISGRYGLGRPSAQALVHPEYLQKDYAILWKLGAVKESPIEDLLKCIQKRDMYGSMAAERLGELGSTAKAALPILETWIVSTNEWQYRSVAALAIRRINPAEFKRLNLPGVLAVP